MTPRPQEPTPTVHAEVHRARLDAGLRRLFDNDPVLAADVAAVATIEGMAAGAELFHQGDIGDAAFVVLAGRLRAVADSPDGEQHLSDVTRGQTVGELALLTGAPRSATVYAIRDSVVARIPAADFDALLQRRPEIALPMTRLLAARLQRNAAPGGARTSVDSTVAVVSAGSVDAAAWAASLRDALDSTGPVRLVRNGELAAAGDASIHDAIDDLEEAGGVIVYAGDPDDPAWNELIVRHADEVLLLADPDVDDAAPGARETGALGTRLRGGPRVTLVLLHAAGREPEGTTRWLEPRPGVRHLHVRAGDAGDVARVARWVTGTSVALVLGGGGARGWGHVGALRAIEELGIPIDLAAGTSHGAVVSAAVADRRRASEMQAAARPWVQRLRDYTFPVVSVMRGRLLGRTLTAVARPGVAIEDLWLPWFAMTTNLTRAERVVQDRGDVVAALRASVSLPVLLPPVIRDGELFIDGGLLDNLPIAEMRRRMGPGVIIAVDPTPRRTQQPYDPLEVDASGWRLLVERLVPFRRRRHVPSIGEIVQRTMMAGSLHLRQRDRAADADTLVLTPQLDAFGLLEFERIDEIVDAGYREMRAPLEAWWRARAASSADAGAAARPEAGAGDAAARAGASVTDEA